ncbi:hypothetical protein ACFLWZ_02480 [Chloroflexota bacterium]
MQSTVRKPFIIGRSKGVTLPGTMQISDEVSMAANDRLLLLDSTGKIPHEALLQFFTNYVQPAFEQWQKGSEYKEKAAKKGGFRPMEGEEPTQAKPGKVAVPPGFFPGPLVYEVTCPRCGRKFGWDVAGYGRNLYCFYCGMPIELIF